GKDERDGEVGVVAVGVLREVADVVEEREDEAEDDQPGPDVVQHGRGAMGGANRVGTADSGRPANRKGSRSAGVSPNPSPPYLLRVSPFPRPHPMMRLLSLSLLLGLAVPAAAQTYSGSLDDGDATRDFGELYDPYTF